MNFIQINPKLSAEDFSKEISIDKINYISFNSGNSGIVIGAGLGFLGGLIFGVVLVSSLNEGSENTWEVAGLAGGYGIVSAIPGGIIGGIIGAFNQSKVSLTLSTVKGDKKEKLMKFLKRNNK